MKVCISEGCVSDNLPYPTWKTDGGCFGGTGCYTCILYKAANCDVTEVLAIAVARTNKLPCVVDTDDYPELFI